MIEKSNDNNNDSCVSIYAMILLVTCIVGGVSYAAYLFIDATHVSNVADVHISKNLMLAASDIQGKLYSDPEKGIKDWMVHTDKKNGYEIKHPNNWKMQELGGHYLFLKYYKSSEKSNSSSFLMTVGLEGMNVQGVDMTPREIALQYGFKWNEEWKEEMIGGRIGLRTGPVRSSEGLIRDIIFWPEIHQKKGMILEATYYTENISELTPLFNDIISEFKFL